MNSFSASGGVARLRSVLSRGGLAGLRRSVAAGIAACVMTAALPTMAAGPYPLSMCAGDRTGSLGCSANDVAIAQVQVTNGVTSCVAGTLVDVGLRVLLQSNANARYDIGVFLAKDGKPPELSTGAGGSASCAVFGVPTAPAPLADLNGNACGDLEKSSQLASVDLGVVSVLCVPDASGNLKLPATVTWEQNANGTCQAPAAAWVEAGAPSKCNASAGLTIPVHVSGELTIVKQTVPSATPGTFAFTATGANVASFALSHGQRQVLATGPLGAAPVTITVTEAALDGWDPKADIVCIGADSGTAGFVVIDREKRRVSVSFTASNSRATCTFVNQAAGRIRVVKTTTGGDGSFDFTGARDFTIATTGGTGQAQLTGLSAGTHAVTEIVPADWKLTSISCADPSGGTQVDLAGATAYVGLAAGEEVTCTFANQRVPSTGTINIVKKTTGGDGTFPFVTNVAGTPNFSLTTVGGISPAHTFTGLSPGVYTFQEQVPPGWSVASISCVDPTGNSAGAGSIATVNLVAGETVTCTFTDTATASVIVDKVAVGGDATFAFGGTAAFTITTASGAGRDASTFASVNAGAAIVIVETVPAGWMFSSANCRDARTNAPLGSLFGTAIQLTPAAGQQAICTFTNTRLAQLSIAVLSSPKSPQSFAYTTAGPGLTGFSLADDGTGGNTRKFVDLMPGEAYSVTQGAAAGWTTPLILCSDRNAIAPADRTPVDPLTRTVLPRLQPGERLSCVFVNVQTTPGSITVVKSATGGDDTFAFANSGGVPASLTNPANFTIATLAGEGSQALSGLAPGTYTITEAPPAGWLSPVSVQCAVLSGASTTITPVANGVTVNLGQTGATVDAVSCDFDNTRAARITVVQDAVPDSAQVFPYTATGAGVPGTFSLVNDGSPAPADRVSFGGLSAGLRRFNVATPAGWRLIAIDCLGNGGAVVDPAQGAAAVTVGPGDDVTCTFRHAREGTISVTKVAPGASPGDVFIFEGPEGLAGSYVAGQTRTASLLPGAYAVVEAVPDGWVLSGISCAGGSVTYTGATVGPTPGFEPGDNTANITLAAGDAVACTFTNTVAGAEIVVDKIAVGGAGVFAFTGTEDFQIDTRLPAPHSHIVATAPGTRLVTEIVPHGWKLSGIACTGTSTVNPAAATATVTLAPGERTHCTFTNEKLGRIEIIKALDGERTTDFSFSVPASLDPAQGFTLTPPVGGGTATRTFVDVPAGTYLVGENGPPNGFRLQSIDCVDPTGDTRTSPSSGTASIALAAGETVSCTFTNATLGSIAVAAVSFLGQDAFGFAATNLPTTTGFTLATAPFNASTSFASQAFTNLPPTTYAIAALTPPSGWSYLYTRCVSDSGEQHWTVADMTATIVLPDGENVRCYYFYAPSAAPGPDPGAIVPVPTLSAPPIALLTLLLLAGGWVALRRSKKD